MKGLHLGEAANNVREIFTKARASSPSVLFIDELDVVAPARRAGGHDPLVNEIVSQMLQEMDGIVAQSGQVFVLAATKLPGNIDPAILIRSTERINIPLPDAEARVRVAQGRGRPPQIHVLMHVMRMYIYICMYGTSHAPHMIRAYTEQCMTCRE